MSFLSPFRERGANTATEIAGIEVEVCDGIGSLAGTHTADPVTNGLMVTADAGRWMT